MCHLCLIRNDSCARANHARIFTWENDQLQNGKSSFSCIVVHLLNYCIFLVTFQKCNVFSWLGSDFLVFLFAADTRNMCTNTNRKGKESKNYRLIIDHACKSCTSWLKPPRPLSKYLLFGSLIHCYSIIRNVSHSIRASCPFCYLQRIMCLWQRTKKQKKQIWMWITEKRRDRIGSSFILNCEHSFYK